MGTLLFIAKVKNNILVNTTFLADCLIPSLGLSTVFTKISIYCIELSFDPKFVMILKDGNSKAIYQALFGHILMILLGLPIMLFHMTYIAS